jgi:hypothetical protein
LLSEGDAMPSYAKNWDWFISKIGELAAVITPGYIEIRTVMVRTSDWVHYASCVFAPSSVLSKDADQPTRMIYPQVALLSKKIPLHNITSYDDIFTAIQTWDDFGTYPITPPTPIVGELSVWFPGSHNDFSELPVWTFTVGNQPDVRPRNEPLLAPHLPFYQDAVEAASVWLCDPSIRFNRYPAYMCRFLLTTSSAYIKDMYLDEDQALKIKIARLLDQEGLVLQLIARRSDGGVERNSLQVTGEEILSPIPRDVTELSAYLIDQNGEPHDFFQGTPHRPTLNGSVPKAQAEIRRLSPIENPAEAIRVFDDLLRRFEALDYGTSAQEDFTTAVKQLERLRATVEKVFGADSQYRRELSVVQFRYARAKQKNAVSYFNRDRAQVLTVLHKILDDLRISSPITPFPIENTSGIPSGLQDSLALFRQDHPDPLKTAFIMMSFANNPAHLEITRAIKQTLAAANITGVRADDKEYNPDLYPNILTYMHGCGFGVAVFDNLMTTSINPNVAFEVGYMLALNKRVCLLKDKTLPNLQADLIGKLYIAFDPQQITPTIQDALSKWLATHILPSQQ